ncbi:MAG: FAD-binding oxidoreductase, partial [Nocardioides sp.]|nr:FAD-binding oxidoreductase [Nocardioides sp.]
MSDLLAALAREGITDASDSTLDRALYSSDASLYRVVPQAVVRPRDTDELRGVVAVGRSLGVPVTMRGAGTSIAGNAVGPGLVVDTSRWLDRVLAVDVEARTARVQPGVVHATLQRAVAPHGLRFGPDPSTHTRCTIGGMIGNNACGSRALGWGRTADTISGLEVEWGSGEAGVEQRLVDLVAGDLEHVRTTFGRFTRQVSGYSLEHLLPEHGRRVDRFLAGTEGTLGVVLEATVDLVEDVPRRLFVLGFASMVDAADAVPGILAGTGLVACEGLDSRIVDLVRAGGGGVPDLPRGAGWLFVETTGPEVPAVGELDRREVVDAGEAAALWRIREAGAGLAARSLATPAYSGWEDAAVPPQHLGAWLRDFDALLSDHGLQGVPYGHFGDGCVHVRIDFPFTTAPEDEARRVFRSFLTESARALRAYGGSLSGEHGDGRARSELLPLMYDERSLALFAAAKAIADPAGVLNPGVVVDPVPMDADLRAVRRPVLDLRAPSLAADVHRCTGVGACVAGPSLNVMCPSWQATRDEKDSTRGRARVLQEALDGTLVCGLDDPAVHEALDLCLSCRGCATNCPTGVDMGTYKARVLDQQYAGRRRPRTHYTLGRLPLWLERLDRVPGAAGLSRLAAGPLSGVAKRLAGVDARRSLPRLASRRDLPLRTPDGTPDVWLWADSFTAHLGHGPAAALVRLLDAHGLSVAAVPEHACCGLTWHSTGQLDEAARRSTDALGVLGPYLASDVPVVALEPSCLAALRERPGGERLLTLAELVTRLDLPLPDLTGVTVVAQPHCHHASLLGWETDEALLRRAGATVVRIGGCCGLAGDFGMEPGHYDVSVAVAETQLLPAVRAAPDAVVLADGFSCRYQLEDL